MCVSLMILTTFVLLCLLASYWLSWRRTFTEKRQRPETGPNLQSVPGNLLMKDGTGQVDVLASQKPPAAPGPHKHTSRAGPAPLAPDPPSPFSPQLWIWAGRKAHLDLDPASSPVRLGSVSSC